MMPLDGPHPSQHAVRIPQAAVQPPPTWEWDARRVCPAKAEVVTVQVDAFWNGERTIAKPADETRTRMMMIAGLGVGRTAGLSRES
ncbi:hypothetical protein GALMADRAFT_1163083 [Galerina marginata CBS 339.88]|uniref:Uncharacterized protein n=1 Tax=Galerina marginata (strain CBS 339.88) TaxID=685588 RepID=A0A067TBM6_GALM3|nr:hypothetical protein GALMADRAFT_1163083 [Galerina marginata CBS 339.88]